MKVLGWGQPMAHPPAPPQVSLPTGGQRHHPEWLGPDLGPSPCLQVSSECSSHSASCSPEWGSALEFGPTPGGK